MTPIDTLLKEAETYASYSHDSQEEMVQHLMELGYVKSADNTTHTPDTHVSMGLESFKQEVYDSHLFKADFLERLELVYKEDWLLNLLRLVTDVDEGISFESLPEDGVVSLQTRIMHYRLDLFGLLQVSVSSAYGEHTRLALAQLQNYGRYIRPLESINALADIEQFTERLRMIWGSENLFISFFIPEHKNTRRDVSGKFKRRLRKDLDTGSRFYKLLDNHVLNTPENQVDYAYLSARSLTDLNRFLVRVIQVHQWAEGTYDGLMDSDFGPVTLESVHTMVALYNEGENVSEVSLEELVAHVGKGYYILNAGFLLKHYMTENERETLSMTAETITAQLNNSNAEDQKAFRDNSQMILDQAKAEITIESRKPGIVKRLYYGIKRVFRKIFRFGARLFKWIARKVSKFFDFLTRFFKKVLKVAGTALKLFVDGIIFLVGRKPIISQSGKNGLHLSHLQLDGDGFTIAMGEVTGSAMHSAKVLKTVRSLAFSLEIVEQVLKLLKYVASAMFTWPLLLMQLVRAFREISEKYKLITN